MTGWGYGLSDASGGRLVTLDSILTVPGWQVRTRLNAPTVRRYADLMERGQSLPPIKAATIGGKLYLMDGAHRMEAARLAGKIDIPAEIVEGLSEADARWEAASANLTHGLPLKPKEHRAVFRAFVEAGKHRKGGRYHSYREMASDLGGIRAHTTLRNWMKKDFPKIAKAMGDDEARWSGGRGEPPSGRHIDAGRTALEGHVRGLKALFDALPDAEKPAFRAAFKRIWRGSIHEPF